MKKTIIRIIIPLILCFCYQFAHAGFYIGGVPGKMRQVHQGKGALHPGPISYGKKKAQFMSFKLSTGSLRRNITRVVRKSRWGKTVVWQLPYDYKWVGDVRVSGGTIQSVVEQIIQNYPLQAVFYNKNRIVVIRTRPSGEFVRHA